MSGGESTVEFRAYSDDAWYSVNLSPEPDGGVRVSYLNISKECDNVFHDRNFSSWKELEEFKGRFRKVSEQLQDDECRSVVKGMNVCACCEFINGDVRFYDACVKEVRENQHSFEKGEEVCKCTFSLLWLHGPNAGKLSTTTIESICKVQPTWKLDHVLASFLKTARGRVEVSPKSNLMSKAATGLEVVTYSGDSLNSGRRQGFFERYTRQETRCARRSINDVSPSIVQGEAHRRPCNDGDGKIERKSALEHTSKEIVSSHDESQEDRELAVERNHYLILVGYLDKTLSAPTIIEFLQNQVSVLPTVYVYPCLLSEPYTKGAFVLNCQRDFQKLWDFLSNPNHIIMSSTGRPWVIIEKMVGLKNIEASIGTLMSITKNILQNGSSGDINALKVISSGTRKFEIADKLRNLFIEFSAHQERLLKRLAFEESKIFYS